MGTFNKMNTGIAGVPGKRDLITDVPGVTVGHCTVRGEGINTGVTAIFPHGGNIFESKVMASCDVINGFGKSAGFLQVSELGTLETPIVMTNTLSVGTASSALVKYMIEQNPDLRSVNPMVCECNDGMLNDIRALAVKEEHVFSALASASEDFEEGAVGAGTGMCCLGHKGGIGSASRVFELGDQQFTLGALVLANFGNAGHLRVNGEKLGERLQRYTGVNSEGDRGSIIIIIATDAPLSERQLRRLSKRATVSLARVGSYLGNGSGDIALAFSTANRIPHAMPPILDFKTVSDSHIDKLFINTADAVEEAIISALYHAKTTVGFNGVTAYGLAELLNK